LLISVNERLRQKKLEEERSNPSPTDVMFGSKVAFRHVPLAGIIADAAQGLENENHNYFMKGLN